MQNKSISLEKMMRASASQLYEEKIVLRIDREALKSEIPKIRFAGLN